MIWHLSEGRCRTPDVRTGEWNYGTPSCASVNARPGDAEVFSRSTVRFLYDTTGKFSSEFSSFLLDLGICEVRLGCPCLMPTFRLSGALIGMQIRAMIFF